MKRIAIAYFWLCLLASALAVFGWRMWLYFDHNADFWVIWVVFMFLVHIRAYLVADEYFQKKMGSFRPSVSAIGGSRPVPVGGVFEFALPGRRGRQQKTIDLDDGPTTKPRSSKSLTAASYSARSQTGLCFLIQKVRDRPGFPDR